MSLLLLMSAHAAAAANPSTDPATLAQFAWVFDGSVASTTLQDDDATPVDRNSLPAPIGYWHNRGSGSGTIPSIGIISTPELPNWTSAGLASALGGYLDTGGTTLTLTGAFTIIFKITRISGTACKVAGNSTSGDPQGITISTAGQLKMQWGTGGSQQRTFALGDFSGAKTIEIRRDGSNVWTAAATGVSRAAMAGASAGTGNIIFDTVGGSATGSDPAIDVNPDNQGIYHFDVADESGGALSAGNLSGVETYVGGAPLT